MKKETTLIFFIVLYFILSIISLKQCFIEGIESFVLNINGILLTPFSVLFSILLFVSIQQYKEIGINIISIILWLMIFSFLAGIFSFNFNEIGFFFIFLLAILEPIKINYNIKETERKKMWISNIKLFFVSLFFIFLASIIQELTVEDYSDNILYVYIYAFLYYAYLTFTNLIELKTSLKKYQN